MFYAALEATLLAYLREDYDSIPALRMCAKVKRTFSTGRSTLRDICGSARRGWMLRSSNRVLCLGAAQRRDDVPSRALAVKSAEALGGPDADAPATMWMPIVARVEEERVLLDLRTVEPAQDAVIVAALESTAN